MLRLKTKNVERRNGNIYYDPSVPHELSIGLTMCL